MSPVVLTVETSCPPDKAFIYVADPARFPEWQEDAAKGQIAGSGSIGVGSRFTVTRRVGLMERTAMSEVTEFDPPRRIAARGIDGPIRSHYEVTIEPGSGKTRTVVTVAVDFEGYRIGKLLAPVVRRLGRRDAAANSRKLRERLDSCA